jgi:hypothetical protein
VGYVRLAAAPLLFTVRFFGDLEGSFNDRSVGSGMVYAADANYLAELGCIWAGARKKPGQPITQGCQ